jgi:hypothetical protein
MSHGLLDDESDLFNFCRVIVSLQILEQSNLNLLLCPSELVIPSIS